MERVLGGGGGDKGRVDRLLLSGRKGEYKKESTVKVRRKAPENTGKAEGGKFISIRELCSLSCFVLHMSEQKTV